MRESFQLVPLGELADLRMGGTPSRSEPSYWAERQSGHPWVSIADIEGKYIDKTSETITDIGARAARLRKVPSGVPVMSFKLTIGRCAIPRRPVFTNEAIVAIAAKEGFAISQWLYHAVPRVASRQVSTAAIKGQTLNLPKLKALAIPTPSVDEQWYIAEALDTIENSIDAKQAIIERLRHTQIAVADALLVNARTSVRPLRELLLEDPRNGYSPKSVEEWTGVVAIGLGCLTRDGFVATDLKNIPYNDPHIKLALLSDGDMLMSRSNTLDLVGLVGRYRNIGAPCIYPDLMMRLRPHPSCKSDFLESELRSPRVRRQIQAAAQGTSSTMVKINAKVVGNLLVRLPHEEDQARFTTGLQVWTDRLSQERAELAKLQLLKQGLAEDLLTGKVRVTRSGEITG